MVVMSLGKGLVDIFYVSGHFVFVQSRVAIHQIGHVIRTGIVRDVQLRIELCQLLQRIFHGQDAANNGAALGIYVYFSTQHFRKTLEHAARYLLMLLGSA